MTKKTFNIKNLPVKYKAPDMLIISLGDLDSLNESRLWFEVLLSAGLTFIGLAIKPFNFYFGTFGAVLLLLGVFFIWRYKKKYKKVIEGLK